MQIADSVDPLNASIENSPPSCFLCGTVSTNVVIREGEYEGKLCDCGLVYTDPRPPQHWDDFLVDHHCDAFYGNPARLKAKWLSQHCPTGRLLEVGCGMGEFLVAARERGYKVTAMEPNPARASHVREEYAIEVYEQFLEKHSPADRFDVVYHCDLLSHFPQPIEALQRMSELLKPDGVLCLEVGVLGDISPKWYKRIGGVGLDCHIWLYSEPALQNLFSQSGLEVVARRRYGLAPYVLVPRFLEGVSATLKRSLWGAAAKNEIVESSDDAVRAQRDASTKKEWLMAKVKYFLRYYVGRVSPNRGPQTLLFVLRPGPKRFR